jgi:multiple sugar transport system ATP-binding protein
MNFFNARLEKADGGLVVDAGAFRVPVPPSKVPAFDAHAGKPVIFGIRPEDIHDPHFSPPGIHAAPVSVKVDVTELMGNEIFLYLLAGASNFVGRVDPRTEVRTGMDTQIVFNMDNMHLFEPEGDQRSIG